MAAYNKFQDFVEQLGLAKHNLNTDLQLLMLTNTQPVNTNTIKTNITEIGAGNGYNAGGEDAQNTYAESGGTGTLTGTKIVWTAAGGTIGPFRWPVLYNDTEQTSPVRPLIGWWEYPTASITLQIGETFSAKFNNSDTTGSILTIA